MYKNQIESMIEENIDQVISWRRHFHEFPELSFEEFKTAEFVADKLADMDYDIRTHVGGTGVIATFDTGVAGRYGCASYLRGYGSFV